MDASPVMTQRARMVSFVSSSVSALKFVHRMRIAKMVGAVIRPKASVSQSTIEAVHPMNRYSVIVRMMTLSFVYQKASVVMAALCAR